MTPTPQPTPESDRGPLTRDDWVAAARDALVDGGVANVKVDPIARGLSATTGSFYWHFKNRDALLGALLEHWAERNTGALARAASGADGHPVRKVAAIIAAWVEEAEFDAALDAAVRDWARADTKAERAVRAHDAKRLKLLYEAFREMGYGPDDARIRARITYFHQVGYYALNIKETRRSRLKNLPIYIRALTGFDLDGTPCAAGQ